MNENEQNEYTVGLSPWINEYKTPGPIITEEVSAPTAEQKSKNTAELYKACQDEVLRRLANTPDRLGRSQMWKVNAIKEDIANKRTDSSVMDWLAQEVITMMEKYF